MVGYKLFCYKYFNSNVIILLCCITVIIKQFGSFYGVAFDETTFCKQYIVTI